MEMVKISMILVFLTAVTNLVVGSSSSDTSKIRLVDFPNSRHSVRREVKNTLDQISNAEWQEFVKLGVQSIEKNKDRLEANLIGSRITVENGSLSHTQLLDTLPNEDAIMHNDIALKILKSSLYAFNSKCIDHGYSGDECAAYLDGKTLPTNTNLFEECNKILQMRNDGHHAFRRLLPRHYYDGFYKMFDEQVLPSPRYISTKVQIEKDEQYVERDLNLALVQWTQFLEHDLSKPVATAMSDGSSIECCNKNYKIQPRHRHPACAELLVKEHQEKLRRPTCFNYVRSALAVGSRCVFSAAEQLNQVTGFLDLSQLYGNTEEMRHRMRTFKNGNIKSTTTSLIHEQQLPAARPEDGFTFCALKTDSQNITTCYMAGDSRINNNPFSILIYTIFMRNHNQVANKLKVKHKNWDDEKIYQMARAININIYRRIIYQELIPVILGDYLPIEISKMNQVGVPNDYKNWQVSNEFGVAAIRFYYTMMPKELVNFASATTIIKYIDQNNVQSDVNLFELKDQIYKPQLAYTPQKLNLILESLLRQHAMKMDATYAEGLTWNISNYDEMPTNFDVLAFDIQRGRDHGLQPYVKYLEVCENIKISGWHDLEKYIPSEHLDKLKGVYSNWSNIDLIVGGISEKPLEGAAVGPTFRCIIVEQFAKMEQWQQLIGTERDVYAELHDYDDFRAAELLCANSDLKTVPRNIFYMESDENPILNCDGRSATFRY